jgi:hypothetical protein
LLEGSSRTKKMCQIGRTKLTTSKHTNMQNKQQNALAKQQEAEKKTN